MNDRLLSAEEIQQATGYKRPSAQARELQRQGVRFRYRYDGKLVVLFSWLNGLDSRTVQTPRLDKVR